MPFDVKQFVYLGKKILGAGLNYRSVVNERKVPIPKEPVLFLKPTSSYITEGQQIEIPCGFEVHHEVELGVIIGKQCKNISADCANGFIGGYCLALDLTAVNLMKEARSNGLPWTMGKGFDTACPVSTAFPADCVPDVKNLRLWLSVNGCPKQDSSTSDMIFSAEELVAYISQYMTLEPFDLILTGTPAGSGRINKGDVITAGLGELVTITFAVK